MTTRNLYDAIQSAPKLPRCKHDRPVMDWSGERLCNPCGCTVESLDERGQQMCAAVKLGLFAEDA